MTNQVCIGSNVSNSCNRSNVSNSCNRIFAIEVLFKLPFVLPVFEKKKTSTYIKASQLLFKDI